MCGFTVHLSQNPLCSGSDGSGTLHILCTHNMAMPPLLLMSLNSNRFNSVKSKHAQNSWWREPTWLMGFWSKYSSTKASISWGGKETGDGALQLIVLYGWWCKGGCEWVCYRTYLKSRGEAVWLQVLVFHALWTVNHHKEVTHLEHRDFWLQLTQTHSL